MTGATLTYPKYISSIHALELNLRLILGPAKLRISVGTGAPAMANTRR